MQDQAVHQQELMQEQERRAAFQEQELTQDQQQLTRELAQELTQELTQELEQEQEPAQQQLALRRLAAMGSG